jgi:hypothetical protein
MSAATIAVPLGQACPACGASGDALHEQLRSYRVRGHSIIRHFWGFRCDRCDWAGPVRPPTKKKPAFARRAEEGDTGKARCDSKSAPACEKRKGFTIILGRGRP